MANEKRLIDANDNPCKSCNSVCRGHCDNYFAWLLTPVDAVEVVHGRWVGYHEADIGYDEYGVRCSNCNFEVEDHEVDFIMNYCPNCGAKMKNLMR